MCDAADCTTHCDIHLTGTAVALLAMRLAMCALCSRLAVVVTAHESVSQGMNAREVRGECARRLSQQEPSHPTDVTAQHSAQATSSQAYTTSQRNFVQY